jgi:alpha-beta hydrolase superfamily lysophospholipase
MQTNFITISDKTELFVRDWLLPDEVEKYGSILIIHGMGEHCGRYDELAQMLNSIGLDVRSYDQRGHGESPGKRGSIPYRDAFLDDAKFIFDDFAKNKPATPFLLGHSMGGGIVASLVARKFITPRGLVMSSPALTAKISQWLKFQVNFGSFFAPDASFETDLPIDNISSDKGIVEKYKNDPLVHNRATPRLGKFILDEGRKSIKAAKNWTVPTLLIVPGNDKIVDSDGAKEFYENLPKDLRTMHFYENLYHETLNEIPTERAKVYENLKNWLLAQMQKK